MAGSVLVIISAYAPQSGRSPDERREFFETLSSFYAAERSHGPCIVLGDFNARLHLLRAGEEDVLGEWVFGNRNAQPDASSNRELMMEVCRRHGL